ncbi:uncharacterized protein EV422DRAFT_409244 [Fimicolochytrium jonesii]|uniref:uncharacterized protein n=1 Tax=Fimicolochytrium jonesii TaxID=1396493 RepID=UPI0022FE95EB|nr:uncharacterized protein EV422DRAFT_409244 [Fimicolochytrium jonesii]KAI8822668.1 hypothetical protein EV422DRAFT_409244 [Fimicolochytrium jonesii]
MFRGLRGGIPAAWSGWFVSPPRTTVAELKPSEEGNATPDSTAPEDRQASSSKGKRGIPQRRRRGCDAGRGNVPAAALSMRTIRKTILGWIDRAVGIDGGDRQASAGRNTNGTVSTTTVKSRSGYANGGRIALRCLLVTCVYALCLALKNAHLLYITLHAGTQISGLPSRSTLSVLMGRDVITAALLGVCLRQLGRRNSVPRRICMAVMGLAAVGEPFTNAVMSISSSWAAEDRMDHTAVVDESGPAFASTRMVRYITIVGRSFLDTVLRQRSWAPVTGVIHGGTAYLSSPALTLSSVPTLIILYVLLKQADEAEDAPPRVTEIASTVSISENVEDKPAEKPISNGSLTDLNITSAASVTKALGETTPRASRTSLWATVATAQEHNAWREGTEYFARELMSSALAAKCAIDHVHVHPVMHEYYMHFVTFISAVDTAIDNVEHLAWQLEHYDSTDNLMKRDGGSMVKRLLTKVLFDPSDVNERVGDAVANLADEKGIELTIHNTVQRGTLPELFLVVGDEDFLRQLLLQILYPIIANAAEYTLVDVTLDMPPPWAVKDDAKQTDSKMPRKYHVDLTWQFTYQVSDESGTPMPLIYNDYVRNLLHELGGQIRGPFPVPNAGVNTQSVELSFKMESVRYRKDIAKSMGLRLSKPMAYRQVEELFHFAETLKDFRVTVLAPCRSTFTGNVVQYLESWGMDLTCEFNMRRNVRAGFLREQLPE